MTALALLAGAGAGAHAQVSGECSPSASRSVPPADPEPIDPPVVFTPEVASANVVRNLDADRDPERPLFHVKSEPPLPAGLENRLELVADELVRTSSAGAESVEFPAPTFGSLRVSSNRKRLSFRVCVDPPDDLPAGKYAGVVVLEGPAGVESATMTLTLNAKDADLFWLAARLTIALVFVVLLYKAAAAARTTAIEAAAGKSDADKVSAARWGKYLLAQLVDLGWMARTIGTIGAVFAVVWGLYEANPAWGEAGPVSSVLAVAGAGLAAVGARTIIAPSGRNQ